MNFRDVSGGEVKSTTSSSVNQLDYLQDRAHLDSTLIVSEEIDLNSFWQAYLGENQVLLKKVLRQMDSTRVHCTLARTSR